MAEKIRGPALPSVGSTDGCREELKKFQCLEELGSNVPDLGRVRPQRNQCLLETGRRLALIHRYDRSAVVSQNIGIDIHFLT